jgi:hypothetical protein
MTQPTIRRILTSIILTLVSVTIAFAEPSASIVIPGHSRNPWQGAQSIGASESKLKLSVVTIDQPNRRQTCHVQSFTVEKLVCSRAIGGPRTYLPEQVLALIVPGDGGLRLPMWLGFNGGLGTAIWGTVALAAACPACAVGTGIAALICFCAAGAIAYADDQPDRLLYLAPGQHLSGKLGSVQS